MVLDPSFVGRTYPPTEAYEVGREKIREFADALGDANAAYRSKEAAQALGHADVIAPPTFAIVLSMRASEQVVLDPELGLDYSRVVHGEQRFSYTRPIRAGDVLSTVVTVETIRSMGGHAMVTVRADISTVAGEAVVTARSMLLARGEEG